MSRVFKYDILPEIQARWSPRAFRKENIGREEILPLLEAARYAPSCFNEQPWRFIIADDKENRQRMIDILAESNQIWAKKAPVLILICSKKTFTQNNQDNYWNRFDAGTCWGYLSLEAQKRGFVTHAMGGFRRGKAKELFHLPEEVEPLAVVAIGRYGDKNDLPLELQEREHPETRLEIEELIIHR